MKNTKNLVAVSIALSASIIVQAQNESTIYFHTFRSPSIGLEYRTNHIGYHAGLYSTILQGNGSSSTEFIKTGMTLYSREAYSKQEYFVGAAFLRGLNRDYKNESALFLEVGTRINLTGAWDLRLGGGVLAANSFKPKFNPTIGISYSRSF